MPRVGKSYEKYNALQNLKLHRFAVRWRVDIKLPGAVFKFQMLLKLSGKNVVIRHRLDLIEHPTTFACRLHILSRPGGCQSLMTEVYYILPNKVTKHIRGLY